MDDFVLLVSLAAIVLTATLSVMALGVVAFLRTHHLRRALLEAHTRIEELEQLVIALNAEARTPSWRPATQPTPAPASTPPPRPATAPAEAPAEATPAAAHQAAATIVAEDADLPFDPPVETTAPPSTPTTPAESTDWIGAGAASPPEPAPIPALPPQDPSTFRPWLIGGAAAGLGAILVAVGAARGWLGPPAVAAIAALTGLASLTGAELGRRRGGRGARLSAWAAPIGLVALAFAIWAGAGFGRLSAALLPNAVALPALVAVAALGVALGLRFGAGAATAGLAIGFLAPALTTPAGGFYPSPALFAYLIALSAAALGLAKMLRWRGFVWLAAGGALIWALNGIDLSKPGSDPTAAAWYLTLLIGLGIAFAWEEAGAPLPLAPSSEPRPPISEALAAALIVTLCCAGLHVALFQQTQPGDFGPAPWALAAVAVACALTAGAAALREGFALAALASAAAGVAIVAAAPQPFAGAMTVNLPVLFGFAGALGFVFSIGGWCMMATNLSSWPGAALSAIGPAAVLAAAHHAAGGFGGPMVWGAVAFFLAAMNALALDGIVRSGGAREPSQSGASGAAAAFALGAVGAFALMTGFAFEGLWLSGALAALVPILAWIDRRLDIPGLKIAAGALALVVLVRLTWPSFIAGYAVEPTPVFNALLAGYGLAIACFVAAARMFDRIKGPADTALVQGLEAGALILTAVFLSVQVRHLANGGLITAPYANLMELAGHSLSLFGLAGVLAWRYGPRPRTLLRVAETAAFGVGLAHLTLLGVLMINPWWGVAPASAPGAGPFANAITAAYGGSALLLAVYAWLRNRQGLVSRARVAEIAALTCAFVWLTLEVRRVFQGPDFETGALGFNESWAISAAWAAMALGALAFGVLWSRLTWRVAALAFAGAIAIKVFLFDLDVSGLWRLAALAGLGGTLAALVAGFQRLAVGRVAHRPVEPSDVKEGAL